MKTKKSSPKAYNSLMKPGSILLLILTLQQDKFRMPLNYNTVENRGWEPEFFKKVFLGKS